MAGESEAGIFISRDGGVVPPVIAPANGGGITQGDMLLDHGNPRAQQDFHLPLHAIHEIGIGDEDGGAAIRVLAAGEIDGRDGGPAMADGEVELGAGGGPGSAKSYGGLPDDGIGVEEIMAGDAVGGPVKPILLSSMTALSTRGTAFK